MLTKGTTTSTLKLSDGTTTSANRYEWSSTGQSWSPGDTVTVKIVSDPPDTTPPTPSGGIVPSGNENQIFLALSESLDHGNYPPVGAFSVTADGSAVTVTSLSELSGSLLVLHLSPLIRQGQVVTVSYTDPTSGDDENALQDAAGNDMASFENLAIRNGSRVTGTPGAPTGLTATAGLPSPPDGTTQIALSWTAPTDEGEDVVTGYRIEWSPNGSSNWQTLVDVTGKTTTDHTDTGLPSPTTRHYRVRAINSFGAGTASNVAMATTADFVGPVPVSAQTTSDGSGLVLNFDENLDFAPTSPRPPASAFEVTADGVAVTIGSAQIYSSVSQSVQLLNLSPVIRRGQAIVVTYTDPTAGDDARAIQDDDGNDAADFALGPDESIRVTNASTVDPVAPGQVRNLAADPGGDTSIVLTWDLPQDPGGSPIADYVVEVCESACGVETNWVAVPDDTVSAERTATHTGLEPDSTRSYRVSAVNGVGTGPVSATATATTTSGAPGAPTGLMARAGKPSPPDGTSHVVLGWTAPSHVGDTAITGYRLERSEDVDPRVWVEVTTTGRNATTHTDRNRGSEVTWHYRVFAINSIGRSRPSEERSVTTDDVVAPTVVSAEVTADTNDIFIVFDETMNSGNAPMPSDVFEVTVDGIPVSIGALVTGTGLRGVGITLEDASPVIRRDQVVVVTYTDPTAGDDGNAIQDTAGNDAATFTTGEGGVAAVVNNSMIAPVAPGQVRNLEAEPGGDTSIVLTWDLPQDPGGSPIADYVVEVCESACDMATNWGGLPGDTVSAERTATHTGLEPDSTRTYRVSAVNGVGTGPVSATAMATTTSGAPGKPTGLTATAGVPSPPDGTSYVDLRWTAPTDTGDTAITGYRLERSADVDPRDWEEVTTTGRSATRHRDGGRGSEVTLHYRVFAINSVGRSRPSDEAPVTTGDVRAPEPVSASVPAAGTTVAIEFDEALDATAANLPAAGRFTLTASDGTPLRAGAVAASGTTLTLTLAAADDVVSTIREGQAITVAYADPTSGDDGRAVQDAAGNDAADFTQAVTNGSTQAVTVPGQVRNLSARPGNAADEILIEWDPPVDNGGSAITDYIVQVCETGCTPNTEANANWSAVPDDTMSTETEVTHTRLDIGDVRNYRVRAVNAVGNGPLSDIVEGQAIQPLGTVDLSVAPLAEGGRDRDLVATVTATAVDNVRPTSDIEVRVTSADGTAKAGEDYTAVDETVTFMPGNFRLEGGRRVARKTVRIAVTDDPETELAETFTLRSMVTDVAGTLYVNGTNVVEATIAESDPWRVAVTASVAELAEGLTGMVTLRARVVRSDGASPASGCLVPFPVTVSLERGGTATADVDYRVVSALTPAGAQTIDDCDDTGVEWRVTLEAVSPDETDPGETVRFAPVLGSTPDDKPGAVPQDPDNPDRDAASILIVEKPAVIAKPQTLAVEEGGEARYTLVLAKQPTGRVTVVPAIEEENSGMAPVTARVVFTRDNWNEPQDVTIRAREDGNALDEKATVTHGVSGADYGGARTTDVRLTAIDNDVSYGTITAHLTHGARGKTRHHRSPTLHFGEPLRVALWWSPALYSTWTDPGRKIGPDRAIRVEGGTARPLECLRAASGYCSHVQYLELTPDAPDSDMVLTLEPLDCRDLNPEALCGLVSGRYTGLAKRHRWTIPAVFEPPSAPQNLTLARGELLTITGSDIERTPYLYATFKPALETVEAHTEEFYRVQVRAPDGEWAGARVWEHKRTGGEVQRVNLHGVALDETWHVRARWKNRFGWGAWSAAAEWTDEPAPAAPAGLAVVQAADGRSLALSWTPSDAAVRYEYRLLLAGQVSGNWEAIPYSGEGGVNRSSFAIGALASTWNAGVRLRAVDAAGRAGASAEAHVPVEAPRVLEGGIAVTSLPGGDGEGRYTYGDRIALSVTMNRPVQILGGVRPWPTVTLDIGGVTREATLQRIADAGGDGPSVPSFVNPGNGLPSNHGTTLHFEYEVGAHWNDDDGISVPANGLNLNGARLVDAGPGGAVRAATFALASPAHFPRHRVDSVVRVVSKTERLGDKVWIQFNADLEPVGRYLSTQQFAMHYPEGVAGHGVMDARVVRGRGSQRCRMANRWPGTPAEEGCKTVRLTLGGSVPKNTPVTVVYTPICWNGGDNCAKHPLAKYRLRDFVGKDVGEFTRRATYLGSGATPEISVLDGSAHEDDGEMVFLVRVVPPTNQRLTVWYNTTNLSAKAGEDYEERRNVQLRIDPNTSETKIAVTIHDDGIEDSGERFKLTLSNPGGGATLGDAEAIGTIYNTEDAVTARFASGLAHHDGETGFAVRLTFSEAVEASAETVRAGIAASGGEVTGVRSVPGHP